MIQKKNWRENGNDILCKVILILGAVIFAVLSYQSMKSTYVMYSGTDEILTLTADSWIKNILFFGAEVLAVLLLGKIILGKWKKADPEDIEVQRKLENRLRIILILVCAYYLIVSVLWVSVSHSHPSGDQASVVDGVEKLLNGVYDRFNPEGYFGLMPHQLSLAFVIEMLFRIFGNGNFTAFQYFSAICMPLLVFSGYKLTREISQSVFAGFYYLILMCVCFPLFYYVPYVYGEVSSTAFMMLSVWLVLRFLRQEKWRDIVLAALALGFAVMLRKNSLIMLIAVLIVLLLDMIRRKKPQLLIAAVVMIAATMAMQAGIQNYYSRMTGIAKLSRGIPSMAWVTMGMQDKTMGPGWYDNYIRECYAIAGEDTEAARKLAEQDFHTRAEELLADKAYARQFYERKILTQWNDPAFECIWMNNQQFDVTPVPGTLVYSAFFGIVSMKILQFMNYYQFTNYLLFTLAMLILMFRKQKVEDLLPVIYVLGGFFFCILWEAKSRYMLPYYVFLIIYAAYGMQLLQEQWERLMKQKVRMQKNDTEKEK